MRTTDEKAVITAAGAPSALLAAIRHSLPVQWYAAWAQRRAALWGRSRSSSMRASLLALLLLVIILSSTAYFLIGQYETLAATYFVIDDAWIHLRFARNLAEGYGFSFNPGEPIAASTAPLWTGILAASYRVTGELALSAYFWGVVFFVLTCFLVYRLVLLITSNFLLAAASATVCSLCPWLMWSALSGMEIMLSTALILTTISLHFRYQDNSHWTGYLSSVAAGFTTLTRPETYVLFLAIVIHRVAQAVLAARGYTRHSLFAWWPVAGLVFTLIVLPYGLFSLKTAGSFFPHTYSAKVGNLGLMGALQSGSADAIRLGLFAGPWLYLVDFVQALAMINLVLLVALPLGLLGLLRRDVYLLPLFLILFPLVVGMVIPTDRVSWPWYRHMLNLIPVLVIVSLVGSYSLLEKILSWAPRWAAPVRRGLVAILVMALGFLFLVSQAGVRDSFVSRGESMKTEHIAIANWINQHLSPEAVVAASDIGVVGFYTDRAIIDTEGLITPGILGEHRRNSRAKDEEVYEYLQEAQAEYLVKFVGVYPSISERGFTRIYRSGDLAVYRTPWARQ